MNELTLEQAAGQVLVLGFSGRDAPSEVLKWARRGELGGIILFKRNLGSFEDVARLIHSVQSMAPDDLPLLVGVDQEGGRVARLGPPIVQLPSMRVLGRIDDAALTQTCAELLGRQLFALGFTANFAPVLDVDTNPVNPVIGDRAFGRDAESVIRHGNAVFRGFASAGIIACGKHFPGHGDTEVDSHLDLPRVRHGMDHLKRFELAPFASIANTAPMLMTAHVVFDALDGLPATLSHAVLEGLLRRDMGYEGVIVSDDLEMKAIANRYNVADAACEAIAAGCDALLVCSQLEHTVQAQEALLRRAKSDFAFGERLRDAARRFIDLRRAYRLPPLWSASDRMAALRFDEARALEEEMRRRAQLSGIEP